MSVIGTYDLVAQAKARAAAEKAAGGEAGGNTVDDGMMTEEEMRHVLSDEASRTATTVAADVEEKE